MRYRQKCIIAASFSLALVGCSSSMDRFGTASSADSVPAQQTASADPSETVSSTPLGGSTVSPVQRQSVASQPLRAQLPSAAQPVRIQSISVASATAPAQPVLPPPVQAKPQAAYAAPDAQKNFASANSDHVVKAGETLFSIGRTYKISPYAVADLNQLPHDAALTLGQHLKIPSGAAVPAQVAPAPAPAQPEPVAPAKVAAQVPPAPSAAAQPKGEAAEPPATAQAPAADQAQTTDAAPDTDTGDPTQPSFRWPVTGRVISGFGAKPGGLRNEGINISVPEGTSVKAAESGVVAYAGNELKGYGNLILIRHANNWVTAYAHNKGLLVKPGDSVKRGDVIARSGQTGSVDAPQLHFEVRKGATAMDPVKFLTGANTASN